MSILSSWLNISRRTAAAISVVLPCLGLAPAEAVAQSVGPLTGIKPPAPPATEYAKLVKNQDWLVALGKALFWDAAIGSDGVACASCHFHAGADM